VLVVAGLALIAVACNNPTYSRDTIERALRNDSGLSAAQAECVARRLEDTIGVERLGARDEPTTREKEKLHAALVFAALACGPRPYDAAAAAKTLREKGRMPPTYADCIAREFGGRAAADMPEPSVAWQATKARPLQVFIAAATIECAQARGANEGLELRRNLGISRQQSACILAAPHRAEAFTACTTTSTTTTTTTSTTTTAGATTSSTSAP
jgi:hypothetical protein